MPPLQAQVSYWEAEAALSALKRQRSDIVPPTQPEPPGVDSEGVRMLPAHPRQMRDLVCMVRSAEERGPNLLALFLSALLACFCPNAIPYLSVRVQNLYFSANPDHLHLAPAFSAAHLCTLVCGSWLPKGDGFDMEMNRCFWKLRHLTFPDYLLGSVIGHTWLY